jgi:hypothetical protein
MRGVVGKGNLAISVDAHLVARELLNAQFASRPFNCSERTPTRWMRRDRSAAAGYFFNDGATFH